MNRREFVKSIMAAASTPTEVLCSFVGGLAITKKIVKPHKIPCFYEHEGWRVRIQHIYKHGWKFIESYWVKGSLHYSFMFHDSETPLADVMRKCEKEMRINFERLY